MSVKVKIKLKGADAKDMLGMPTSGGSASQQGEDHKSVAGGKKQMDENPQSRQAEGKNADEKSDITKVVAKTSTVNTSPEARVNQGFDCVTPVNRTRPEDSPEAARQKNNRVRDMRTALGRGIPSSPTID